MAVGSPGGTSMNASPWMKKPQEESMSALAERIRPEYKPGYDPASMSLLNFNYTPSKWLSMSKFKSEMDALKDTEKAGKMANSQTAASLDDLAARGGLSSGARERSQQEGMKNFLGMAQEIGSDQNMNELNMGLEDYKTQGQARQIDIGNQKEEINRLNQSNMDIYKARLEAEAAARQAAATRKSGGGGCCFIFLEARYGDGTMDSVVRRFRDEHMTEKNKRGYYKLSEVLVPLMRKHSLVKFFVRAFMTDPLVSFGKWHYSKKGLGWMFKPVKDFWLKTFNYLGEDHEFVRENGEVV